MKKIWIWTAGIKKNASTHISDPEQSITFIIIRKKTMLHKTEISKDINQTKYMQLCGLSCSAFKYSAVTCESFFSPVVTK